MKLVSAVRSRFFSVGFLSVAMLLGSVFACGPVEPPKQASGPDQADPNTDPSGDSRGPGGPNGSGGKKNSGGNGGDVLGSPNGGNGKPTRGKGGDAPQVNSLASFLEGAKWGMSHAELTQMFVSNEGVIWKDYNEKLKKARVGPEMNALEAEREQAKNAFQRSYIEFGGTPTGYDTTGIRNEYTYKNKEALMWIQRQGKKRYYFFINDRLWKMYDEIPLTDGGPMGAAYLDAVNILNGTLNAQGRVQGPDQSKNILATTVDWKDGVQHLRAIDRSNDHVVGLAVEDNGTLSNIDALRPNKPADPMAIDPSVTAVTKGHSMSDPNGAASASASASGKKGTPPPPKKKP